MRPWARHLTPPPPRVPFGGVGIKRKPSFGWTLCTIVERCDLNLKIQNCILTAHVTYLQYDTVSLLKFHYVQKHTNSEWITKRSCKFKMDLFSFSLFQREASLIYKMYCVKVIILNGVSHWTILHTFCLFILDYIYMTYTICIKMAH